MAIGLHKIYLENSHIWGENVYKRDRFLGKFKKGPPHIGEYEKKCTFWGGKSPFVVRQNHPRSSHHIKSP